MHACILEGIGGGSPRVTLVKNFIEEVISAHPPHMPAIQAVGLLETSGRHIIMCPELWLLDIFALGHTFCQVI